MWNEKYELPDGSYFVSDTQDYFEYIIKKSKTLTNDPPRRIYVKKKKKIENRITCKIKRILSRTSKARSNEFTWKH